MSRSVTRVAGRAQRLWTQSRTSALVIAGFGAIDYAVFQLAGNWGWIAVGVSLLAIEALSDDENGGGGEPAA